MRDIGSAHGGKTPAQVAINWTMCKGAIPIVGELLGVMHFDMILLLTVSQATFALGLQQLLTIGHLKSSACH